MPFLIDGHNLIPKLGISLRNVDDEMQLVAYLQAFCRAERKQVEVYFDGAPTGQVGTRRLGLVTAHFVRLGSTADAAIRARLKTLGRAARNWTVVTSDRQVQADARAAGAVVISSDVFAGQVIDSMRAPAPGSAGEAGMSDAEVEDWLRLFREKPH
ncbi:MAG TPA: NYN domain-containing protein [Anaerolineales bacterium]|nr:NYN domain-containing protein [Anaerolineales bacterium]